MEDEETLAWVDSENGIWLGTIDVLTKHIRHEEYGDAPSVNRVYVAGNGELHSVGWSVSVGEYNAAVYATVTVTVHITPTKAITGSYVRDGLA